MRSSPRSSPPSDAKIAWQDVEDLLNEISQLAKSECAVEEFGSTVARHTLRTLEAAEVALWLRIEKGTWQCVAYDSQDRATQPRRTSPVQSLENSCVASAPFNVTAAHDGIIEVVFPQNRPALAGSLPVGCIEAIAEILADFYRKARLSEWDEVASRWATLSALTATFHADLDFESVAYRIANESRGWLEVDRVSVLARRSGRLELLAVSGVDSVEKRADISRTLVALASTIEQQDELFWSEGTEDVLSPEVDSRLQAFLEHSPARCLIVLPLRPAETNEPSQVKKTVGVLVIENFGGNTSLENLRSRLALIRPHASSSLANALQHQSIPGVVWFDRLMQSDWNRLLTRSAMLGVACLIAALALLLIPADFKIEARGELQPAVRREVYAPEDGVIVDLRARHGDAVAENDVVLRLARPELDLETARVQGELQTAQKRLAAVQSERLDRSRRRVTTSEKSHQATAEEELKETVKSLERQKQILALEREQLQVRSPLTGHVLTWNVESLLAGRPVARGQQLLTVADTKGPWQLRLQVADDRMGHILSARDERADPLQISYVVATDPGRVYQTRISEIGQSVDRASDAVAKVNLTANLEGTEAADFRPGAEVIAQIHCGRRSLGYVWFHDLIDAVRGWIFF